MNNMKNILSTIIMGAALTMGMTGCMDDFDAPNVSDFQKEISVAEVTGTQRSIGALKMQYCSNNGKIERPSNFTFSRNTSNWETLIEEDIYIEGVICANDGEWGALYQSLYVRNINGSEDDCILVGVKNTCLYPFYPVGQRVRINLKGLYIGAYSRSSKIGYPYFTSSGNHNLGPIPMEIFAKHIQLIGTPDPTCAECQLVSRDAAWLRASANKTAANYPNLATVEGTFTLKYIDDKSAVPMVPDSISTSTLAPDAFEDAGYGVSVQLDLGNGSNMLVRTSTGNELSHIVITRDQKVQLSGVLDYDSYTEKWQLHLRDTTDFKILN